MLFFGFQCCINAEEVVFPDTGKTGVRKGCGKQPFGVVQINPIAEHCNEPLFSPDDKKNTRLNPVLPYRRYAVFRAIRRFLLNRQHIPHIPSRHYARGTPIRRQYRVL